MVRLLVSFLAKLSFSYVFWVVLLSLRWENETLYDRSYEFLVNNEIMEVVEEELSETIDKIIGIAKSSYAQYSTHQDAETL